MHLKASRHNGVVLWATGGVYRVLLDSNQQIDASLRGRLKLEERTGDRVVAGDRVYVEQDERSYVIESVAERKSELARRAPGRNSQRAKVLVANVDQVVLVIAAAKPEPRLRMLDRLLVLTESNDLPAIIIVNKIDLVPPGTVQEMFAPYERASYQTLFTSLQERTGLEALAPHLCGRESVLAGPSGVGKSSLLNQVQPGLELRTAEVSRGLPKGQHTTVSAQLIPLDCGGFIVDTPGMKEVGLWDIDPDALDTCFPEFRRFIGDCRFTTSCSHTHEPDCAVRDAVTNGAISLQRYDSYRDLYKEASESAAAR